MKRRIVTLFSLITVLALCIVGLLVTTVLATPETYSADSIFKASVGASYTAPEGDSEGKYVTYTMGAGSNVTYGKNLALKWYEGGEAKYFSATFAFGEDNFKKFTFKLEAAQHTMNKDEKSVNEITFTSKTQVSVNGSEAVTLTSDTSSYQIAITEAAIDSLPALDGTTGEYYVTVNGQYVGTFKNIGSNYAEYKSGSITPITFAMDELKDGTDTQSIEIREINTQEMKFDANGKVVDNKAPVFVVNDDIKVLMLGESLSLDYKTIDVLDSSVSTQFFYNVYGEDTINLTDKTPESDESGYTKADSMSKVIFFEYGSKKVEGHEDRLDSEGNLYVSIAFRLTDGENKQYYYLENYAGTDAVEKDGLTYVKVAKDVDSRPVYDSDTAKVEAYQDAVDAAAKDGDKSIQIGSGAYYYLPSLRSLISDANCGYTELEFDIYYKNEGSTSNGSSTGLSYNELKFAVSEPGYYEFKVVATNAFGKTMLNDNGDAEITSSNVWDDISIPAFSFEVENTGPSIEEKESSNDLGYIDVAYTFPSFEIVAISGYQTQYKLYRLTGNTSNINLDNLNADPFADAYKDLWVEVDEYDSAKDDDEGDNVYEWRSSSRSFIPQEAGYYMVTVEVFDGLFKADSHQIVSVTSKVTTNRGETYWLRDNIVSIVFMVIGGICLIAIIILLVVKPKEEEETVSDKKSKKQALKEKRANRNK